MATLFLVVPKMAQMSIIFTGTFTFSRVLGNMHVLNITSLYQQKEHKIAAQKSRQYFKLLVQKKTY